ncbi:MAG: DUF2271 domain-containing protein [Oscillospiraceae bacterium]|nr:DUF2271 domain-containing protein [Oscillospiraceae bacterium]
MKSKQIALACALLLLLCAGCAKTPTPPESTAPASKEGGLIVTFDYEKQSGHASNQYAVWIEDMDGKLVKTLCATEFTAKGGYKNRSDSLATWVNKAMGVSDFDAVASATPKTGTWSCWWDLTDEAGDVVLPGTYKFLVEGTLRWKNYVLFTGEIEIGDAAGAGAQAVPEYFFKGEGNQPALDESAPEARMITHVRAAYGGG